VSEDTLAEAIKLTTLADAFTAISDGITKGAAKHSNPAFRRIAGEALDRMKEEFKGKESSTSPEDFKEFLKALPNYFTTPFHDAQIPEFCTKYSISALNAPAKAIAKKAGVAESVEEGALPWVAKQFKVGQTVTLKAGFGYDDYSKGVQSFQRTKEPLKGTITRIEGKDLGVKLENGKSAVFGAQHVEEYVRESMDAALVAGSKGGTTFGALKDGEKFRFQKDGKEVLVKKGQSYRNEAGKTFKTSANSTVFRISESEYESAMEALLEPIDEGKGRDAILAALEGREGEEVELSSIARHPSARGVNFKDLQSAAKAMKKEGKADYDGISKITLKEEADPEEETLSEAGNIDALVKYWKKKLPAQAHPWEYLHKWALKHPEAIKGDPKGWATWMYHEVFGEYPATAAKRKRDAEKGGKEKLAASDDHEDHLTEEELDSEMQKLSEGMEVANTIMQQLGKATLFMLGAKNFVGSSDSLSFKIGRNGKNVNGIYIKLMPEDLYDVEFLNASIKGRKVVSKAEGIMADQLHDVIREHTGMAVKMPKVVGINTESVDESYEGSVKLMVRDNHGQLQASGVARFSNANDADGFTRTFKMEYPDKFLKLKKDGKAVEVTVPGMEVKTEAVEVKCPKNNVQGFIKALRACGVTDDASVVLEGEEVKITVPADVAERVKDLMG
jgi:hypothetical protein